MGAVADELIATGATGGMLRVTFQKKILRGSLSLLTTTALCGCDTTDLFSPEEGGVFCLLPVHRIAGDISLGCGRLRNWRPKRSGEWYQLYYMHISFSPSRNKRAIHHFLTPA